MPALTNAKHEEFARLVGGGYRSSRRLLATLPAKLTPGIFGSFGSMTRTCRARLPKRIIDELDRWLDESGADEIVKWGHTMLAHAAGPNSPKPSVVTAAARTADQITKCIRAFVRVAEAVTNTILGRSSSRPSDAYILRHWRRGSRRDGGSDLGFPGFPMNR
jgi:hypothetical protein